MPALVICDPTDQANTVRQVEARHAPRAGRVVCHPTPVRGLAGLSRDVLVRLGKRFDAPQSPQDPRRLWQLAGDWLAAESISDLVILRAHLLDAEIALRLHELLEDEVIVRLWLIAGGPELGPGLEQMLATNRAQRTMLSQLPCARPAVTPADPVRAFPRVPRAEFILFARACRQQLTSAERLVVGEAVAHGEQLAQRAWQTRDDTEHRRLAETLFMRLLRSSSSPDEALARFRGAQAELFRSGLYVAVDTRGLHGLHARLALDAPDDHHGARLRHYSAPRLACAGALSLALHRPASELRRLNIEGLLDDPSGPVDALRGADLDKALPPGVRPAIAAHLRHRARQGAHPCDPVFTSRDTRTRIRLLPMHHAIKTVARHSALRLDLDLPQPSQAPEARIRLRVTALHDGCSTTA